MEATIDRQDQAIEQGHAVTALVRDATKANFAPAVVLMVGDVLDRGSLTRAVEGQEAVICSESAHGSGA